MKKWIVILALIGFWACSNEEMPELPPEQIISDSFKVDVPSNFSWSAIMKDVVLINFIRDSLKTYDLDGTPVELYNQDNELIDALIIYHGTACFNICLPLEVEKLKIKLPAIDSELEFSSRKRSIKYEVPEFSSSRIKSVDSDNDGLYDKFDAAPNNPNVTLKIGNLGKTTEWSTFYLFEDLWPTKGDFDFNDFIINTNYSFKRGIDNFITEITGMYNAEWSNPDYGLGFELFEVKGAYLIYHDNLIEEVVGGDMEKSMNNGINVLTEATKNGKISKRFTIKIREGNLSDFVLIPFLYRLDDNFHQVRPFGTPPTQLQKMELFKSGDDDSPNSWQWTKGMKFKYPLEGKRAFYRTCENYSWCVQFMAKSFVKPAEEQSIIESYPRFKEWVQSCGLSDYDWYNNPSD
jgi:hypothetical protein